MTGTNNFASASRRRRQKKVDSTRAKESQTLMEIRDIEKTQMRGGVPEIRDIPKIVRTKQKPMLLSRTYEWGRIVGSATVDQTSGISFNLSQLPDYGEFTALFDQYRILQAIVRFLPTSATLNSLPLYTAIDQDDSGTVGSLNSFYEYETLQISGAGMAVERVLTPKIATAAYTGTFSGYTAQANVWINSSSPTVQHYGLKYYLPALSTGNTQTLYTIVVTLWVQFKGII